MAYDEKKVDDLAKAIPDLLKLHAGRDDISEVSQMHDAIDARGKDRSPANSRFVVEAAEQLTGRLDDKSLSGSKEWEAVSKLVDVVMDRNQPAPVAKALTPAQIAARSAAMAGRGM